MLKKYHPFYDCQIQIKTKCTANIFGRGRKRKTTKRIDQAIQRKVKVDRQKLAPAV